MSEIDDLLVRLDMDIRPLKKALAVAEACTAKSAARIEKLLSQPSKSAERLKALMDESLGGASQTRAATGSGSQGGRSLPGGRRVVRISGSRANSEFQRPLGDRFEESQDPSALDAAKMGLEFGRKIKRAFDEPIPFFIENVPEGEQFDTRDLPPSTRVEDIVGLEESIRASRVMAEGLRGASGDVFREQGLEFEGIQDLILRALERDLQAAFTNFNTMAMRNGDFSSQDAQFQNATMELIEALREARGLVDLGDPQINATLQRDVERIEESFAKLAAQLDQSMDGELIRNVEQLAKFRDIALEPTVASQNAGRLEAAARSATIESDLETISDLARQVCACLEEIMSGAADELAKKICDCSGTATTNSEPPDPGGGRGFGIERSSSGGFFEPAAFGLGSDSQSGLPGMAALAETAAPLEAALARTRALPPALAQAEREMAALEGAARDLGEAVASALEGAILEGEGLSDILKGLERDAMATLTRALITDPLRAATGGGLGGIFGQARPDIFGQARPDIFGTPPLVPFDGTEEASGGLEDMTAAAAEATPLLTALGGAGDAAGGLLRGSLAEGALKAALQSFAQATAASSASAALVELTGAAAAAAAALRGVAASSAAGGGGGEAAVLASIFGPGPHRASGGMIHGPGGPTGDRIPALLSDGEFVVNARASRVHRALLEAINSNRLLGLESFRNGGPVLASVLPEMTPIGGAWGQAAARDELSIAERPIVVNINNPSNVPQMQRSMSQIRGSLREMLAHAERRNE